MDLIPISIAIVEQNEINPLAEESAEGEEDSAMPKQIVLIKLIAQEPALYDPKHNDYRNNHRKEQMWGRISKRVGWTDHYCKSKWKALRDQYCRELKRARLDPDTVIKWKYFEDLDFLRPFALYRNYRPKLSSGSPPKKAKLESCEPEEEYEEDKSDEHCSSETSNNYTILKRQALASLKSELNSTVKSEQCLTMKSDDWNLYSSTCQMNGTENDITSEIMEQISQSANHENIGNEPQEDDDDDDPIHTFLNIESYFEEELITMIKAEDILYNPDHASYKHTQLKLVVWEDIARRLKKTVRQCRLKWKALRDQFIREHKRIMQSKDVDKSGRRWKHYDALKFLTKFFQPRKPVEFASSSTVNDKKCITSTEQQDMMATLKEVDQEISQNALEDGDGTSPAFINCHSNQSLEEEYILQEDKRSDSKSQTATDALAERVDDDEVGAFFRAVAMKIRKTNMSPMAFTELQIDILRAISNALKNT